MIRQLAPLAIIAGLAICPASSRSEETRKPYDGSWQSLQQMPVPAWFDDGKIGIFIHWGPYSAIGYRKGGRGYAEHVPKMIYEDPQHYFPYLKQRWGANPPEFGYKDIIPEFKAEKWDPDAWAKLFKEVGATYVVLTAEHHDGWANWDSDITPWNAVDKGPRRDLVGDLGKAVRKQGLKYAPSFHRERHQTFFTTKKYVVNAEPREVILEEIKRMPEAASLYGPFGLSKAFVDDYVARWQEIQKKYQPDMLWMDDFPIYTRDGNNVRKGIAKPEVQYFDDRVRGMITDFMNDGAARGQAVYVNNKGGNRNWPDGVGCLEKDNLKLKVIGPKWQSCTTFGTSFGYLEGDKYKTVEGVIHEMIEVISRNGNFLINIGPRADGTIPEPQVERLHAMGAWLKINQAAIYGSRYWKHSDQPADHLAFTTNGNNLYAIKLEKPASPFTITGTKGWKDGQVKAVSLLGSDAAVSWSLTPAGLKITPPADLGDSQYAWTFEIVTDRAQHTPNVIQHDAGKALKGTGEVDLDGHESSAVPPVPGSTVVIESAPRADAFSSLRPPAPTPAAVTANTRTKSHPLALLTDGTLAPNIGPVFANGVHHGAYKMDLGSEKSVTAITSWSHNYKNRRGYQKLTLYGSDSTTDPGWNLDHYTPLGSIDTTTGKKATFTAASLRTGTGKSLGSFRWIVWAASPVNPAAGGENTAFQEFAVETADHKTSALSPTPTPAHPATGKPNVLFIFADDQMWNTLGSIKGCPVKTPNLDKLADLGASFSHAYNMGSFTPAVCVASRTMLNTGSFVWRAATFSPKGNNAHDPNAPENMPAYTVPKRQPEALWADYMKRAGYETYFAGKWHVAGYQPTFDHLGHVRPGMPGQTKKRYARPMKEGEPDTWSPYDEQLGGHWKGGKHWSEVLGDEAVDFLGLAKQSDQPFFIYLAFNAPHDPRQSPKKFVDMYPVQDIAVPENFLPEYPYCEAAGAGRGLRDEKLAPFPRTEYSVKLNRREYFAIISHMDEQIGRILDALEASGKADNTYVFFTADHGLAVGDHGFIGKQNMYDSSMRVPMLVAGPGIQGGKSIDAPVYLQDVMATTLDLAGVQKPAQVEFNSLLPLATGKTDKSAYPEIYGAYFGTQRMLRTDRYKMIIYPTINMVRLYDMIADPLETNDLAEAASRPDKLLNQLFARFQQLQKEMDDPVDVSAAFRTFMNS
ncbi:MAG: alpha-L-fucosidase [Verrucomicrobiota bacterium JB025]|nr:alpha-L-fucosidase [Verrucomicrobiota bacterium JB025]